jgi:hypothetical protein
LDKPVKAVIKHYPDNSSEHINVVLQQLDLDSIIVKQTTPKRPTPEGGVAHTSLTLSLVTVARNQTAHKSQADSAFQHIVT